MIRPIGRSSLADIEVIAPNLKRRLSGVTATIVRLLPVQAESINIVGTGLSLPAHVPFVPLRSVILMSRQKRRVWHARRNTEMLLGLLLRHILRKCLKLVFTSASQRHHTCYTRRLIARMDAVVATSGKSASYLRRPSRVVMHGIDTDSFRPPTDRAVVRQLLNLPDCLTVGCYGRIRHQKGTDVFVDAMLDVLPLRGDVTAVVMGRATKKHRPFLEQLRTKVSKAGLQERILFLPEVPVEDMPNWYKALDLFVAPQRWEGFGLTVLEAMACGAPVIATTAGVFDEIVLGGRTGCIVPPGNVDEMTSAINRALESPDLLKCWSKEARRRVVSQFRIEDEAATLNQLYRELLDRSEAS